MHQYAVLHHLAAAAELQHPGADGRVVHAGQIAGQLLVGNTDGSSDRAELRAQELGIRTAHVRRIRELDVLARFQNLQGAGFEACERDALAVGRPFAHQVVFRVLARDEAREHRGGLLAHQLGVVVLVEFVQLDQRPRQPRLAANLAGPQHAVEVNHLARVHAHRLHAALPRHRREPSVLRMRAVQVVGHTSPQRIELDARAHHVAGRQIGVEVDRQVLRLQQLELQGHGQSVFRTARAQPDQAFTAFEHRTAGQGLQAVEVGQPRRVGFLRPVAPQRLHVGLEAFVVRQALWLDAGADGVGDEGVERGLRPRITAHEVAALDAQIGVRRQHRGDCTRIAGHPRQRPAATACGLMYRLSRWMAEQAENGSGEPRHVRSPCPW